MNKVEVRKDELVTVLEGNREKHRAIFEKAQTNFRAAVIAALDDRLAQVKAGKKIELYIAMPEPEDHTRDYNRVLKMLEMSVEETIVLDASSFAQYVMDDWQWKRAWAQTSNSYLAIHEQVEVD